MSARVYECEPIIYAASANISKPGKTSTAQNALIGKNYDAQGQDTIGLVTSRADIYRF